MELELSVGFLTMCLMAGLVLGLIPAFIARYKGRSFIGFWIYGIFLWPVALIHSLVLKDETVLVPIGSDRPMRKLPTLREIDSGRSHPLSILRQGADFRIIRPSALI